MDFSCQINATLFYPPGKIASYPWKMAPGGSLRRSRHRGQILYHFLEWNRYFSVRHGVISKAHTHACLMTFTELMKLVKLFHMVWRASTRNAVEMENNIKVNFIGLVFRFGYGSGWESDSGIGNSQSSVSVASVLCALMFNVLCTLISLF